MTDRKTAAVRAVLGHFIFVYIHPYADGNGRIGRFLMNLMLASGGYNWTVIRVEHRQDYMASLEKASVQSGIAAFTKFVAKEMKASAKLRPSAMFPNRTASARSSTPPRQRR